jgi:hypothetical protein
MPNAVSVIRDEAKCDEEVVTNISEENATSIFSVEISRLRKKSWYGLSFYSYH